MDSLQEDDDGVSYDRRRLLAIYRRREMWNITNVASMATPTDAASIIAATGRYDNTFVKSYARFLLLLQKGSIGINVPVAPRPGHPKDNEKVVDYWIAVSEHADADISRVGVEACIACNIQLSSAVVERSFATLTNNQKQTTLLAGPRYLRNLMMFTGNRAHLADMYRAPMRELACKLG